MSNQKEDDLLIDLSTPKPVPAKSFKHSNTESPLNNQSTLYHDFTPSLTKALAENFSKAPSSFDKNSVNKRNVNSRSSRYPPHHRYNTNRSASQINRLTTSIDSNHNSGLSVSSSRRGFPNGSNMKTQNKALNLRKNRSMNNESSFGSKSNRENKNTHSSNQKPLPELKPLYNDGFKSDFNNPLFSLTPIKPDIRFNSIVGEPKSHHFEENSHPLSQKSPSNGNTTRSAHDDDSYSQNPSAPSPSSFVISSVQEAKPSSPSPSTDPVSNGLLSHTSTPAFSVNQDPVQVETSSNVNTQSQKSLESPSFSKANEEVEEHSSSNDRCSSNEPMSPVKCTNSSKKRPPSTPITPYRKKSLSMNFSNNDSLFIQNTSGTKEWASNSFAKIVRRSIADENDDSSEEIVQNRSQFNEISKSSQNSPQNSTIDEHNSDAEETNANNDTLQSIDEECIADDEKEEEPERSDVDISMQEEEEKQPKEVSNTEEASRIPISENIDSSYYSDSAESSPFEDIIEDNSHQLLDSDSKTAPILADETSNHEHFEEDIKNGNLPTSTPAPKASSVLRSSAGTPSNCEYSPSMSSFNRLSSGGLFDTPKPVSEKENSPSSASSPKEASNQQTELEAQAVASSEEAPQSEQLELDPANIPIPCSEDENDNDEEEEEEENDDSSVSFTTQQPHLKAAAIAIQQELRTRRNRRRRLPSATITQYSSSLFKSHIEKAKDEDGNLHETNELLSSSCIMTSSSLSPMTNHSLDGTNNKQNILPIESEWKRKARDSFATTYSYNDGNTGFLMDSSSQDGLTTREIDHTVCKEAYQAEDVKDAKDQLTEVPQILQESADANCGSSEKNNKEFKLRSSLASGSRKPRRSTRFAIDEQEEEEKENKSCFRKKKTAFGSMNYEEEEEETSNISMVFLQIKLQQQQQEQELEKQERAVELDNGLEKISELPSNTQNNEKQVDKSNDGQMISENIKEVPATTTVSSSSSVGVSIQTSCDIQMTSHSVQTDEDVSASQKVYTTVGTMTEETEDIEERIEKMRESLETTLRQQVSQELETSYEKQYEEKLARDIEIKFNEYKQMVDDELERTKSTFQASLKRKYEEEQEELIAKYQQSEAQIKIEAEKLVTQSKEQVDALQTKVSLTEQLGLVNGKYREWQMGMMQKESQELVSFLELEKRFAF